MKGLHGKAAIVTGAAQGIGKAIAERLTEEGVHVLWADINEKKVQQAQSATRKGIAMKVDISQEAEVQRMVARACEEFGTIHILVNNAARFVFNFVTDITEEDWDRVLGTNVKGTAFAIKHTAQAMMTAKVAGSIVNIASTSAFVAQPSFVPYSTSKGAILQITRCSALDLGRFGIRVNALCPGPILTDASEAHAASVGKSLEELCEEMTRSLILQRMGEVSEVAAAVAFLASEESSFITGTTLTIDGGLTAL